MTTQTIFAPDLGTDSADVIEILVNVGDKIAVDTPLMVLESAKASMEVPSSLAGTIQSIQVKVGDKVSEGKALLQISVETEQKATSTIPEKIAPAPEIIQQPSQQVAVNSPQTVTSLPIFAPDLGTDSADVIEILVNVGDKIAVDTPLMVLESAKASMEVPSSLAGTIQSIAVKVGDKISQGMVLVQVTVEGQSITPATPPEKKVRLAEVAPQPHIKQPLVAPTPQAAVSKSQSVHCGPAVRRLARELGVDLQQVTGTAAKGRIVKEDIHQFVKQALNTPAPVHTQAVNPTVSGLPILPDIDFSKWGEVEFKDLSKIQKLSAQNLHRAWLHIPHVTQFDEADITDLEAFRVSQKDSLKAQGVNLTLLSFLVKACAYVLEKMPKFNSSLSKEGEQLIIKKYIHIGVAVDTPNGLVVPVIRNANQKSVVEIAKSLAELSTKARDKKLTPAEMQGATFSISSLGGIGGTAFTPIVNWPEVAILGVSRSSHKPIWDGKSFNPRLILPLSLSYDHRVIDGADAARFTTLLSQILADIRRVLL
ncbi:MAG TPA: dihydrolipoyllysine-residue acetyltransferase [Agitococcus sp.]|nr:dihydrolipoyllysine-residue acetyltransferase [Agitococcus sp.]